MYFLIPIPINLFFSNKKFIKFSSLLEKNYNTVYSHNYKLLYKFKNSLAPSLLDIFDDFVLGDFKIKLLFLQLLLF